MEDSFGVSNVSFGRGFASCEFTVRFISRIFPFVKGGTGERSCEGADMKSSTYFTSDNVELKVFAQRVCRSLIIGGTLRVRDRDRRLHDRRCSTRRDDPLGARMIYRDRLTFSRAIYVLLN